MIFLNFKTYEKGSGANSLHLVSLCERVVENTGVKVIPVVQPGDVNEIVQNSSLEIWVQKIDPIEYGAHTGSILPESVVEDGAMGTFLNHSENKSDDFELLAKAHDRARDVGLKTLVFAKNTEELKNILSLNPNFVSYEPPEYIGSSSVSVAKGKPEVVEEAVLISQHAGIPLIVGAGIHSFEDVKKCLELGATGIAVASDVMVSEDPEKQLTELAQGFK